MRQHRCDSVSSALFILFVILCCAISTMQNSLNFQYDMGHLPQTKFNVAEYSEYPDNEEKDRSFQAQPWNQVRAMNSMQVKPVHPADDDESNQLSDALDPDITWDSEWGSDLSLKQVSAVSVDPNGNVAIFHRGDRVWDLNTFDRENRFNPDNGPVQQNTIVLLDKSGKRIIEWGQSMFYLPHGLTVDSSGNYWMTDVAMHQVFKFSAEDIRKHWEELKEAWVDSSSAADSMQDRKDLIKSSVLKPNLTLGEAFVPGNDEKHFCKPTAVAVHKNGDFFVSDGYCNSRIIKFNKNGERISQWGRHWGSEGSVFVQSPPPYAFFVPHALAIAEEQNYLLVADRENGRVSCFHANNGTIHKQYKHSAVGTKVYSIAYARGKIYLVNGPDIALTYSAHVRGFIMDLNNGNVLSQFGPASDLVRPHDIAVTEDGSEIYVVDLDTHRVYRFLQGTNSSKSGDSSARPADRQEPSLPVGANNFTKEGPASSTLVLSFVTAAVIFIAFCVGIAAVVARCQKRGCLLTVRKRMHWEADRRENFKLSSLLEGRRGKGFKFLERRPNTKDFRKLNTEPETSEDEHPENTLTKII